MEAAEIMVKMKNLGYRAVSEFVPHKGKFEIIVEPWDWDLNIKRSGRTKRTGHFFGHGDCCVSSNKKTEFGDAMREVQLKLIAHFNAKD